MVTGIINISHIVGFIAKPRIVTISMFSGETFLFLTILKINTISMMRVNREVQELSVYTTI